MKIKVAALSCLTGLIVLSVGYEYSRAESKTGTSALRIGVVSIQKVFADCRRIMVYRGEVTAEREQVLAEFRKLEAEIEATKAGLRTLKVGSSDYVQQFKELLNNQGSLQSQEEFYKQKWAMGQQNVVEAVYKDILRRTSEVAREKGLDLVLERSNPQLPSPSTRELEAAMGSHKVLYSDGCVDITEEVLKRVDASD